jgi:hypothetical protein
MGLDLSLETEYRDALGHIACSLAARDPGSLLGGYGSLGVDRHEEAARRLSDRLDRDDTFAIVGSDADGPLGLAVGIADPVLSAHFGFGCARVELHLDGRASRTAAASGLLDAACVELVDRGVSNISTRSLVEDFATLDAAQRLGFRVVDSIITYLVLPEFPGRQPTPSFLVGEVDVVGRFTPDTVRELDPSIGEFFAPLLEEHYTLSRFHADPHFDDRLAGRWYSDWCRRAFAGEWADGLIVAWLADEPIGFMSWKLDSYLAPSEEGQAVGSGLGASIGHGAYSAMVEAAARSNQFRWAEFDLHIANHPVNRALGRSPFSRILRVTHTLHRWVGHQGGTWS